MKKYNKFIELVSLATENTLMTEELSEFSEVLAIFANVSKTVGKYDFSVHSSMDTSIIKESFYVFLNTQELLEYKRKEVTVVNENVSVKHHHAVDIIPVNTVSIKYVIDANDLVEELLKNDGALPNPEITNAIELGYQILDPKTREVMFIGDTNSLPSYLLANKQGLVKKEMKGGN